MENFTKESQTQNYSGIWRKVGRSILGLAILFAFAITANAQTIVIGTGTSNTNGTAADAVGDYYNSEHYQILWTAAELTTAGLSAGDQLTSIGFSITEVAGTLANYTVQMAHTTNATASVGYVTAGLTTVVPAFSYTPTLTAAGVFDVINFTTNFTWDGTSNIIVDFCTGNANPYSSPYGGYRYTASTNNVRSRRSDGSTSCGVAPTSTTIKRPNVQFGTYTPPLCTGTPNNGTVAIDQASGCAGGALSLTSSGLSGGPGLTYNWQVSTDNVTFANIGGATGTSYNPTSVTGTTYYRIATTCSSSGLSGYSPSVNFVGISCTNVVVPFTGNASIACGTNAVVTDHAGGSNYNPNADGYLVLENTPGSSMTINGTYATESCCDDIFIYYGTGTSGTQVPGSPFFGSGSINITGTDGQIFTIRLDSDGSVQAAGFELTVLYSGTCAVCAGTPAGGAAAISDANGCAVATVNLSATGLETVNIDYQWQRSIDGGTTYTDISGATSSTSSVITPVGAGVTYYRLKSTCTDSGLDGFSTPITYTSIVCSAFDLPGTSGSSNTLACGTNTWLYDDAGGATNYLNNFDSYTVLDANATAQISLSGNYVTEGCCDDIYIYYGVGTAGTQVPGSPFAGTGSINITGNVGEALTVRLDSDGSVTAAGFAFQVIYSGTCASCTGAPANGTVSIPSTSGCSGNSMTLTTTGLDGGPDITYQWQVSNDNFVSDINDVSGQTGTTYTLNGAVGLNYYRIASTCSAGPTTSYSNIRSFTGIACTPISTPTSGSNTVSCGVTTLLTDDGGTASAYSNNADGYTVFEVNGATASIAFSGTYAFESCCDRLYIYSGVGTGGALLYSYGAAGSGTIAPFTFGVADGSAITFRLDADGSVTAAGIEIIAQYSGACDPCPAAPSVTAATSVTATSATINWNAAASVPFWYEWEVRDDVALPGTGGEVATGTTNNATFTVALATTLTGNTTYRVYARSLCTGSDFSGWNGPLNFTTLCDAETAPTVTETFATYTGNAPAPACWSEATAALPTTPTAVALANSQWVSTTGFANTGSNSAAKTNVYGTGTNWLISQAIDLGVTGGVYRVDYRMAVTNYNSATVAASLAAHQVHLVVSPDGGATWDDGDIIQTWTGAGSYGTQSGAINIPVAYTGVVKFAFVVEEGGFSPDVDFHLDDFEVEVIPTCFEPGVTAATNVANSSATLNWTAAALPTPTNYQWEVRTSGAGGSGATGLVDFGTTVDGTILTANTVATLTGQVTYSVYVRSFCGGSDYSAWNGPVTFTTECDPEVAPTVNQTFAGFVSNPTSPFAPLVCWSEGNGAIGTPSTVVPGNSSWVATSGFGNAGSNPGVKQNVYGTDPGDWLISHPIDLGVTAGLYRVSYRFMVTNYNSSAVAGTMGSHVTNLMISNDGGTTWNAADILASHTGAGSYTAATYTVNLTTQTGVVKFAFVNVEGGFSPDVDVHIDDFIVELIPPCLEPSVAATTLVTDQTATINWVEPGTLPGVGYQYEVRESGAAGSGATGLIASGSVAVGTDLAAIVGLTASTPYTVYVRSECTAGTQFSAWATINTFTTACTPEVAPTVLETFDTYDGSAPGPFCWTEATGAIGTPSTVTLSNNGWILGTSTPGDPGDFSPTINLWGTTNDWLISHPVDLGVTAGDFRVSFDIKLTTYGSPFGAFQTDMGTHEVSVIVSQDAGATWNAADVIATYTGAGTYDGTTISIDLTAYSGVVKIAFVTNTTAFSPDMYFWVDDFIVEEIPTCFEPTALSATSITIDGADVSWTAPTLGVPVGYEYEISTSATPGTGTAIAGTSVSGVTGLSSGTLYYLHVRTQCVTPGDFSEWATTSFTTIYENPFCNPTGVDIPDDGCGSSDYLEQQVLVSGLTGLLGTDLILNKVALNIVHTYDADLRIILKSPAGTEVLLSEFNGGSGNNYGGAACNETPTNFRMDAATAVTAGSAPFNGNYLPEGDFADFDGQDPNGLWTLRVCDDFAFDIGTLVYYRLQIIPPPTCFAPVNLASNGIGPNTATVTWDAGSGVPGPSSYQFYYNTTGIAPTELTTPTGPATGLSIYLNTLTPGTHYYIWVRSDCGLQQSEWSSLHEFETTLPNDACSGATDVACGGSYNDDSSTASAEVVPGQGGSTGPGLWYKFVGTGGDVTFSTCATGTTFDSEINVLTGPCGSQANVGNSDDDCGGGGNTGSSVTVATTAGTDYYIYVSSWASFEPGGAFTLDVSCGGYWTGNVNTDWANAGNWSDGTVPGSGDNAVIPTAPSGGNFPDVSGAGVVNNLTLQPGASVNILTGGSVTVEGDLINNGIFNIANDASLVQETGSGLSGGGHVNVTRVGSSVYDYWSSPVVGGGLGAYWGFNSANSTIDPSDDANDPGWFQTNGALPLAGGGAFYGAGTRTFSGVPNNGNISRAITNNPAPADDWNLVGNPYPSGISTSAFLSNNTVDGGSIALWDESDYAYHNGLVGSPGGGGNTPTGTIGSTQAFMVQAATSGNINFTNSMRVADNTAMLFRPAQLQTLAISVSNTQNLSNTATFGFYDDALDGLDSYDTPKLNSLADLSFFSYIGQDPFAINFYSPLVSDVEIPLGLNSGFDNSMVTFTLDNFENLDNDNIILEDRLANVFTDLKTGDYTFTASAQLYTERFFLHFSSSSITGIVESQGTSGMNVYVDNGILNVFAAEEMFGNLEVLDMSGRIVLGQEAITVGPNGIQLSLSQISDGIYVVRMIGDDSTISQKILK